MTWFEWLNNVAEASTRLLTSLGNDFPTEIENIVNCLQEIKEMRTIINHKADQFREVGNQWLQVEETMENEVDYFNICQQLLVKLNENEIKMTENVHKLGQKEEIKNGKGKKRIADLLKRI